MNFLIETKQEYTIHLVNAIYPLLYEGLSGIYEESKKTAKNNDELKIFQLMLSGIKTWNQTIIDNEYNRILRMNTLGKTIEDLLKAVIKANIVILTNTDIDYDDNLLKELNIQDDFKTFVHLAYVECARTFYNSAYLFYHKNTDLEIKRHQTEILDRTQVCIQNAIRKMIPLQITIKTYLENKNTKVPNDVKSESEQIKNLLYSEKNTRASRYNDVTPSSPRKLQDILQTTMKSEEYKNPNSIIKDNSKVLHFSEKSLRDSILELNTEQNMSSKTNKKIEPNVFLNTLPSKSNNIKSKSGMSESSVYYEPSKNNVIEEYSNKLEPIHDNQDREESSEKQILNKNTGNKLKYFSHLNV
jgi:hypothetical protein